MKRKVVACAVLACVLAPAAFAGCAGGSVDASTQAGASPDAAPVMPVNHSSARFDAMGASVVTIEADTVDASSDTAGSFAGIPGVLGVNLVYCNFEDDSTL